MRLLTSRIACPRGNRRRAQAGSMPTNVAAMQSATTEVCWGGWRGYGYGRTYCPTNGACAAARYYGW